MGTILIGIAGGSGSGKTTLANNLVNYFGEDEVNVLLRVLFGPRRASVAVADVDDVEPVGHLAGTDDAAVLGDDVAVEEDAHVAADADGGNQCLHRRG